MEAPRVQHVTVAKTLGLQAFVVLVDGAIRAKQDNMSAYKRWVKALFTLGISWVILVAGAWILAGKSSQFINADPIQLISTGLGVFPLAGSFLPYRVIGPEREELAKFQGVKQILESNEPMSSEERESVRQRLIVFFDSYFGKK